jgi:hypothetical protein
MNLDGAANPQNRQNEELNWVQFGTVRRSTTSYGI